MDTFMILILGLFAHLLFMSFRTLFITLLLELSMILIFIFYGLTISLMGILISACVISVLLALFSAGIREFSSEFMFI